MGRSPQSQVYHLVENEAPSQGFSAEPRETFKNNFLPNSSRRLLLKQPTSSFLDKGFFLILLQQFHDECVKETRTYRHTEMLSKIPIFAL